MKKGQKLILATIAVAIVIAVLINYPFNSKQPVQKKNDVISHKDIETLLNSDTKPVNYQNLQFTNWKEFTPIEKGLTVKLPGEPKAIKMNIPSMQAHFYTLYIKKNMSLNIISFKFVTPKTEMQQLKMYENVESSLLNSEKRPRKLIQKIDHSTDGVLEYELIVKEKWLKGYSRSVMYVTANHYQSVAIASPNKEDLEGDIANYFFKSVKIND